METPEILDGKYRIVRQLGAGGMGAVYLAEHLVIGKKVAIKRLHSSYATSSESTRLLAEARAAAAIGHPAIIDVYDVGTDAAGAPYLVMELLEGESLGDRLSARGRLEPAEILPIVRTIVDALGAAHAHGIVHRDLKPDNVFLARGAGASPEVKLLDFGIAKIVDADQRLTGTGMALGTPAYMAPEQARGQRDVDARADLYAVGVLLYEALTGRLPFTADNYNALLLAIVERKPLAPRDLRPDLSEDLEAVVLWCLEKDLSRRVPSAQVLAGALDALAGGARVATGVPGTRVVEVAQGVAPTRVGLPERAHQPSTRLSWEGVARRGPSRRSISWVLGALALAALVGLAIAMSATTRATQSAADASERPAGGVSNPGTASARPPDVSPKPPSSSAGPDDVVEIDLRGLPAGARVVLDGAEVSSFPIRVRRRDVDAHLRVEARGYETLNRLVSLGQNGVVDLQRELARRAAPAGRPTLPAGANEQPAASATDGIVTDRSEFERGP